MTTLIIIAGYLPDYALREYIHYEAPQCNCGAGSMQFVCMTDDPLCPTRFKDDDDDSAYGWNTEVWACSRCSKMISVYDNEYGGYEVTYTPEEYAEKIGPERQEYWLRKRYKTAEPVSIKDYWQ